ncbi:hypothetical protein K435DRAFT_870864 [Dendrothele bispora CBS 962.96]|uniref:Uncharacterized protein n=1 Tax=Dendrothele bispora (strain CBS 962.96) TaxID=1314807 RepID=A0A4S8L6U4_DENBC|nr:hypothetical protein K435DRAFT_870864 [Dendrothele bispora CBS 962.96]
MIIVSEVGDKTFLIAAILAMSNPRITVFAGALGSLVVMKWTQLAAAVLFLVFGSKMLMEGRAMGPGNEKMEEEMKAGDATKRYSPVLATSFYVFVWALASPESLCSPSSSPALPSASIPCVPRAGSFEYNHICSLLQRRAFRVQSTRQSGLGTEKEFYAFRTSSSDDLNSCPENAFVCWNDPETSASVAVAEFASLANIPKLDFHCEDNTLVTERNGTFICDESIDSLRAEPSSIPSFSGGRDGVHSFEWRSSHACPRASGQLSTSETIHAEESQSDSPQDAEPEKGNEGEENGDEGNLVDHVPSYSARRRAAIILAIVGGILNPSPTHKTYRHIPPTYYSRISPYFPSIHLPTISTHTFDTFKNIRLPSLKVKRSSRRRHRGRGARPHLFRVDENRLVQWVREDHSQLVGERGGGGGGGGESFVLEEEEDFMVNEFDEAVEEDYLEEGLAGARGAYGEHVPLSAGITGWGGKGGRKNCGTAGSKA